MMEAMAYPFYDVWRNLVGQFPRAQSVTISGGGFKHSPLLAGVFADVFGCDPWLCEEAESSARGAVLLASEALGLGNVERSPGPRLKRVHFDPGRHTVYRAAMDRYTSLYKSTFG